jgi:hypothetical protein
MTYMKDLKLTKDCGMPRVENKKTIDVFGWGTFGVYRREYKDINSSWNCYYRNTYLLRMYCLYPLN